MNVRPSPRSRAPFFLISASLLALSGCAVGPDYKKPTTPPAEKFVENAPWKEAAPKDALPKGNWWKIFNDPALDQLETQVGAANQTLAAAVARRDQARAIARVTLGDYFPTINLDPTASRARFSGNRQVQTPSTRASYTTNSFNLPLDLSYELDLFGRVRRSVEAAQALADASEATYVNVLLSVQADVAQTYFILRSLTAESDLVKRSIQTRQDALDLVKKRYAGGASGQLDVFRAEAELASAQSDALALDQRRTSLRHALAVLCGQTPETFTFNEDKPLLRANPPALPIGLPSEMLERRPDVAAAERTLAAANAQIGVAKAAYFPSIRLIGSAGYNSDDVDTLFKWNSRQWSLGPSISLPLFQGGRIRANYDRSLAAYEEAIANYRQRVLTAFQDVDDGLSGLRYLDQQAAVLDRAVNSSRKAADLSTVRYKAGLVSYLEVVDSERTALANERIATQLNAQRFTASVLLVKALGGSW
jgi:multidrug efflux system outer membrane protein